MFKVKFITDFSIPKSYKLLCIASSIKSDFFGLLALLYNKILCKWGTTSSLRPLIIKEGDYEYN